MMKCVRLLLLFLVVLTSIMTNLYCDPVRDAGTRALPPTLHQISKAIGADAACNLFVSTFHKYHADEVWGHRTNPYYVWMLGTACIAIIGSYITFKGTQKMYQGVRHIVATLKRLIDGESIEIDPKNIPRTLAVSVLTVAAIMYGTTATLASIKMFLKFDDFTRVS